jgi:hypothetical protein
MFDRLRAQPPPLNDRNLQLNDRNVQMISRQPMTARLDDTGFSMSFHFD